MKQNDVFKGKLGLRGTLSDALSRATPIIIDTLEDHGHEVHTFASRSTSAVHMQLDQYSVELRHRPQMKRGWKAPQCDGDMLELRLFPSFPSVCDQELTEMLLAALLYNLVVDIDVVSVKWLDAPVLLTRNQFLSAFEPLDVAAFDVDQDALVPEPLLPPETHADPETDAIIFWEDLATTAVLERPSSLRPARLQSSAPTSQHSSDAKASSSFKTRPRGRSVFAPVDVTARALEHHCDEILMANHVDLDPIHDTRRATASHAYARPTRALSRMLAFCAAQFRKAAQGWNVLRTRELRYSFQILLLTAVALYLDSAGMVRAAISLLQ